MVGRKTASLVAVLWLLLAAEMAVKKCRGWGEEAVQDVKDNISEVSESANLDEKTEAVKKGASEAYHDAKDTAGSWSSWAYDKISKGFGNNEEEIKETAHYVVDKAGDAGTTTTQAATDASNYASEKAGEAVKAASTAASSLKSTSEHVAEAAKENLDCENCKEKASQAAGEIGARIKEKTSEL